MIIGIEFNKTRIPTNEGIKTYVRIAPYFHNVSPHRVATVKLLAIGVALFTAVVAIGKAFAQTPN